MPKIIEPILTPQDAAWGRQVNDRQADMERNQSRALLDQTATNKGVAASLDSLSRQYADLRGRVSYVAADSSISTQWTTTQSAGAWGPTLSFTLTERRIVSLDFRVNIFASAESYNGSTRATVSCTAVGYIDGNSNGTGADLYTIAQPAPGAGGANQYQQVTLSARVVVTLDAGTHTFQGGFATRGLDLTGTSASGAVSLKASKPYLFADVLQIGS